MAAQEPALYDADITGEFEAVTEAELVTTEEPPGVVRKDSGVRPSATAAIHRMEIALAASTRLDSSLSDLLRTAKFLTASLVATQEANRGLTKELETLAALGDVDRSQRAELERRIQQLESDLAQKTEQAAEERRYLLHQQDSFVLELMSDHERQIAEIRAEKPNSLAPAEADATTLIEIETLLGR
ncbi:MAG TPA: hypothetical protein VMF89_20995 [Polyangiales bacterium]|nr:hypothetical protein [Polyangiales bacterium]